MGVLGLKLLLRLSYAIDYLHLSADVDKVCQMFISLWEEEVMRAQDVFAAGKQKRRLRKSSIFRIANRRLSDTEMRHRLCKTATHQAHEWQSLRESRWSLDPKLPQHSLAMPRLLG